MVNFNFMVAIFNRTVHLVFKKQMLQVAKTDLFNTFVSRLITFPPLSKPTKFPCHPCFIYFLKIRMKKFNL